MIDLFLNISPCEQPDILQIVRIIKTIMSLICIIIPICVLVFVSIDFAKNVMASSDKDMSTNAKLAGKRIMMGIAVFLVPTIVMAVNSILGTLGVNYSSCLTNATTEGIASAKIAYKAYQDSLNSQINNTINNSQNNSSSSGATIDRDNHFSNLKGHNDDSDNNTSGSDTNPSTSGGDTTTGDTTTTTDLTQNVKVDYKTLYVGDSRTKGFCDAKDIKYSCIAEVSKGLKWLKTTSVQNQIKSKIEDAGTEIMVISLGINDLGYVNDYVKYYQEMATKYPRVKIIVTSVTRVFDDKTTSIKNNYVRQFNDTLKNNLGSTVAYCDIYTPTYNLLKGGSDGIHYDTASYKIVHNAIASECINKIGPKADTTPYKDKTNNKTNNKTDNKKTNKIEIVNPIDILTGKK